MMRAISSLRVALAACLLVSSVLAAVSVAGQSRRDLARKFARAGITLSELVDFVESFFRGDEPPVPMSPASARVRADLLALESAMHLYEHANAGNNPAQLSALWAPDANGRTFLAAASPGTRVPPDGLVDPWGRAYVFTTSADGAFEIATLGADGKRGGVGDAADVALSALRASRKR